MSDDPLLSVRNLVKHYPITEGWLRREVGTVRAVDGIDFEISRGETFGLVGESGCGKSTTAQSILRLEEPTSGEIRFDGEEVTDFSRKELRSYRRRVQFILQDPESAFNPRMTVGEAVGEPLRVHGMSDRSRRQQIVEDVLERVGLDPDDTDQYPHEFSGGEKQRLALGRALVLNPDLIIADEPTSALDGRTKDDVLRLMKHLQEEFDLAILLISHDIDLVRRFCDRVAVMYVGSIVEHGEMEAVVGEPHHPYTRALISSVPSLDPSLPASQTAAETLTDEVPDASDIPTGCRFSPRCPELIPPTQIDLTRDEWLGVTRLRLAVPGGWSDVSSFLASLPVNRATIDDQVRAAFELPAELSDPAVEAAVQHTIDCLEREELKNADESLTELGTSVCERASPPLSDEETPHLVACHRYDPDEPGEPVV